MAFAYHSSGIYRDRDQVGRIRARTSAGTWRHPHVPTYEDQGLGTKWKTNDYKKPIILWKSVILYFLSSRYQPQMKDWHTQSTGQVGFDVKMRWRRCLLWVVWMVRMLASWGSASGTTWRRCQRRKLGRIAPQHIRAKRQRQVRKRKPVGHGCQAGRRERNGRSATTVSRQGLNQNNKTIQEIKPFLLSHPNRSDPTTYRKRFERRWFNGHFHRRASASAVVASVVAQTAVATVWGGWRGCSSRRRSQDKRRVYGRSARRRSPQRWPTTVLKYFKY